MHFLFFFNQQIRSDVIKFYILHFFRGALLLITLSVQVSKSHFFEKLFLQLFILQIYFNIKYKIFDIKKYIFSLTHFSYVIFVSFLILIVHKIIKYLPKHNYFTYCLNLYERLFTAPMDNLFIVLLLIVES